MSEAKTTSPKRFSFEKGGGDSKKPNLGKVGSQLGRPIQNNISG